MSKMFSILFYPVVYLYVIVALLYYPHVDSILYVIVIPVFLLVLIGEQISPLYKNNFSPKEHLYNGIIFIVGQVFVAAIKIFCVQVFFHFFQGTQLILSGNLYLDILLAFIVGDFFLYGYHRWSHVGPNWLWKIHELHHIPKNFYAGNFATFHPINAILSSYVLFVLPLYFIGFSQETILLTTVLHAVISLLSHANISVNTYGLSFILSTSNVHIWHHSIHPKEANFNFASSIRLWDFVFGTYKNSSIPTPTEIGVSDKSDILETSIYPLSTSCSFCNFILRK